MEIEALKLRPTIAIFSTQRVWVAGSKNLDSISTPERVIPSLEMMIYPTSDGRNIDRIIFDYYPAGDQLVLRERIDGPQLFRQIISCMDGSGQDLLTRMQNYLRTISDRDAEIIIQEYTRSIENSTILDGWIAGMGAYIGLVLSLERDSIMKLPFRIPVPTTLDSRYLFSRNCLQYFGLPLIILSTVVTGPILQWVLWLQNFIQLWDRAYLPGPSLDTTAITRMCIETITNYTQYTISQIQATQQQYQLGVSTASSALQVAQAELKNQIGWTLDRCKREVKNLTVDVRAALVELSRIQGDLTNWDSVSSSGCSDGNQCPKNTCSNCSTKSESWISSFGNGDPSSYPTIVLDKSSLISSMTPEKSTESYSGESNFQSEEFQLSSAHSSKFTSGSKSFSSGYPNSFSSEYSNHSASGSFVSSPSSSTPMRTKRCCENAITLSQVEAMIDQRLAPILDRLRRLEEKVDGLGMMPMPFPTGPRPCPGISSFQMLDPNGDKTTVRQWNRRRTEPLACE